jgi:hypothetical protein
MLGNPNACQGERSLEDTEERESRGGGEKWGLTGPVGVESWGSEALLVAGVGDPKVSQVRWGV